LLYEGLNSVWDLYRKMRCPPLCAVVTGPGNDPAVTTPARLLVLDKKSGRWLTCSEAQRELVGCAAAT
jgi:hypothetical protein